MASSSSSSLDSTKKMIRSVLTSSKAGVPATKFHSDYQSLTQSRVQFQTFGFSTLHEFILSIPDVARVASGGGVVNYHAVASEETQHIHKMVAKQLSKKKKKKTVSFKCAKPYQRFFMSTKHFHVPSRNMGHPKTHKSSVCTLPPRMQQSQHRRTTTPPRQTIKVAINRDEKGRKIFLSGDQPRRWTTSVLKRKSDTTDIKISSIIINRIKTLLGENPMGVFSKNLAKLYFEEYGCELSQSVIHGIETSSIKDVAKVEKTTIGERVINILFPFKKDDAHSVRDEKKKQFSERDASRKLTSVREDSVQFTINSKTNEMIINEKMKKRIKSLLRELPKGISNSDFKRLYMGKFGCEVPDSVLYGIECGQVRDVARVETKKIGNRELITYFPLESFASKELAGVIDEPPVDRMMKTRIKRVLPSIPGKIKDPNRGKTIYYDASKDSLSSKMISAVRKGVPKEVVVQVKTDPSDSTIILPNKNETSKLPKYPGLSAMDSTRTPLAEVLPVGSKHDVLITHIENCDRFFVQLASSAGKLKFILDAGKKSIERAEMFPFEKQTHVISCSGLPRRGTVIKESVMFAEVFFMDYGDVQHIDKGKLALMSDELYKFEELAIFCSLYKPDSCNPWSERASSKFQQLCSETKATIEIKSVEKKLVNGVQRDIHVVSCWFRSFDINNRLMMENPPFMEATNQNERAILSTQESEKVHGVSEKSSYSESGTSEALSSATSSSTDATTAEKKSAPMFSTRKPEISSTKTSSTTTAEKKSALPMFSTTKPEISSTSESGKSVIKTESLQTSSSQETEIVVKMGAININEKNTLVEGGGDAFALINQKVGLEQDAQQPSANSPALQRDGDNITSESGTLSYSKEPLYVISPTQQDCPAWKFGRFINVTVTNVFSLDKFYMLPVERMPILETLTTSMNSYYHSTSTLMPDAKFDTMGSWYAAPINVDGTINWRRVSLKKVVSSFASVFLVDLGELECVPLSSLRTLAHEFAYIPTLALLGRLCGIIPKNLLEIESVTKLFENVVMGRQLIAHLTKATVVKNSTVFDVCLFVENAPGCGQWINDMMVEEWQVADYTTLV